MRRSCLAAVVAASFASGPLSSAQEPPPPADPGIRYRSVLIERPQSLVGLRKELGTAEAFLTVLKINRLDLAHVRQGDALIVPDRVADLLSFSPFPAELPASLPAVGRLLIVSARVQAFGAYEHGTLVRWGPTSTGRKETPTPAALYHTNWRSRLRRSTDNAQWLLPWLVNFENARGISFHQFDLPGYPASHACVRLLEDDARWIYDWAEFWMLSEDRRTIVAYGTPVVVFGEYAYDAPPPWRRLVEDPLAATVGAGEIEAALQSHAALIADRARERAEFLAGR